MAIITINNGTFAENIAVTEFHCPLYINGSASTVINGYFTINDCVYVGLNNFAVNSGFGTIYVNRSKVRATSLILGGGGSSTGFIVGNGSFVNYSGITDGITPVNNMYNVNVGGVLLYDVSAFSLTGSKTVNGFATNGANLVKADYDDAITKKHTQGTDTILDEGGTNEVLAEEIVDHIADTNNPHETELSQVLNTLFGQDIYGNLRPQEDYFGQGGFFEIDANFNIQPKDSLTGITDFFLN